MRTRAVPRTLGMVAAVTLAATACSSDTGSPPSSGGPALQGLRGAAPVALVSERTCDAVLDDFQTFAPEVLSDQWFGGMGHPESGATTSDEAFVAGDVAASTGAGGTAGSAAPAAARLQEGSSSDTNTQEAGIDEPDVVENDGAFVYLVDQAPDQANLVVLDAATAEVLSRTPLGGHGSQILLHGDRLLALTGGGWIHPEPLAGDATASRGAVDVVDEAVPGETAEPPPPPAADPQPVPQPAPQPGPGSEPLPEPAPEPEPVPVEPEPIPVPISPGFPAGTVLQLLDVSDRRAPRVLQTTEIEGHHVSTRVVDGVARVVISSHPDARPMVDGAGVSAAGGPDEAREAIATLVASTTIEDWLPDYRTTVVDDAGVASRSSTEGQLVACEDVFVPEVNAGIAQTSVLRVDFEDGFDPADTTTVVAEASTVYASASTLYLAANSYVPLQEQGRVVGEQFNTALHAFDLGGDGAATHVGAGEVPGHLLNQYSLSEHDGYLRAATTEGASWGGSAESHSGVRVLRLDGNRLVEVGAVTGLGVTETIQSVRFMGPVGYVVTFRQTDPLYVIDLSDPTDPRAVGELKIPGFSSYLHPVGEGRLVGIGRDADLEGRDRGLLVSLFDVSDPTAPAQLQTWTARDAWSMAGDDPRAFLHWAPESAVIVPIERFSTVEEDGAVTGTQQSGIVVLDVGDGGITERAVVTAEGRYASRALVVQGRLWSLFDGGVVVSHFDDLASGTFTSLR